jgi:NAD(P)-dependent dehydrogenase (short-subunit alcohol dehydrogenase family)
LLAGVGNHQLKNHQPSTDYKEVTLGDRLKDKVAIVTGAGRGIGRAEAMALAAEGAKVVVNNRTSAGGGTASDVPVADEVVEEIKKAGGIAVPNYASIGTDEGAKDLVKTAVDNFGRVDILVNNAAILRDRMVHKMTDEEWDSVVQIGLYGPFYCTRAAAPMMRENRWGRIVFTSSQAGAWGRVGQSNYAAAKEGLVGFCRVVSRELGPYGITANTIRPRAGTRVSLDPKVHEAWAKEGHYDFIEQSKMLKAEHVGAFVTYLCTDEAADINGRIFVVGTDGMGLYREPEPPHKVIYSQDLTWSVDQLIKLVPMSLGDGLENPAPPKKKE